jgi:hypothetical protein
MCLDTVSRLYDPPKEDLRTGYKVFKNFRSIIMSEFAHQQYGNSHSHIKYQPGIWYESYTGPNELESLCSEDFSSWYPAGFHIFPKLKDARAWCDAIYLEVYQVQYDRIVAVGNQTLDGDKLVHVALEMKIIKKVA